tara:strand:- start:258 stop:614 length:357 start_codon:yes stop_codon:yes gene_type:complete
MIFSPHFKETTTKEPLGDDINKSPRERVLFLVYLERRAKRLRSNRLLEHKEVWSEEKGSYTKSSSTREEKRRKEPPPKNNHRVVVFLLRVFRPPLRKRHVSQIGGVPDVISGSVSRAT